MKNSCNLDFFFLCKNLFSFSINEHVFQFSIGNGKGELFSITKHTRNLSAISANMAQTVKGSAYSYEVNQKYFMHF
jgi:hypothetical protein